MAAVNDYLKAVTRHELQAKRGEPAAAYARVGFLRRLLDRLKGVPEPGPAMPDNPIYALCAEFGAPELWAHYHAFRMNPCGRTWKRLRNQTVPWLLERKLGTLIAAFSNSKKTPDVDTVTRTLLTFGAPTATGRFSRTGKFKQAKVVPFRRT
jgi:hypothetical protein